MLNIKQNDEQIIIKGNNLRNALYLIMASIMSIAGIFVIAGLLPLENNHTSEDIFVLVFVIIWEVLSVFAVFKWINEYSKYITITDKTISCFALFKKEVVQWCDVKDWGLSYYGNGAPGGNIYHLYFSKSVFEEKNECKKKLKGKHLKFDVYETDYEKVVNEIIAFCEKQTSVSPFIGKNKFHII